MSGRRPRRSTRSECVCQKKFNSDMISRSPITCRAASKIRSVISQLHRQHLHLIVALFCQVSDQSTSSVHILTNFDNSFWSQEKRKASLHLYYSFFGCVDRFNTFWRRSIEKQLHGMGESITRWEFGRPASHSESESKDLQCPPVLIKYKWYVKMGKLNKSQYQVECQCLPDS